MKNALPMVGLLFFLAPTLALADITGTVSYSGKAPRAKLKVTKDHHACGKADMQDESLVIGSGGSLANVVISIEGVKGGSGSKGAAPVLDQVKCRYVPHVQTAHVGQQVELRTSDPILHNVHAFLDTRTIFNLAMPIKGQKLRKPLKKAGVIKLKCDAGHTWMSAYIVVKDHPYVAVSDKSGKFSIKGVPAGTYDVEAWHEKLGTKKAKLTVDTSGSGKLDVKF